MQNDHYPLFSLNDAATYDEMLEFIKTLMKVGNKDAPGWENMRHELMDFGLELLKNGQKKHRTMKELAPMLWYFYCGYTACHKIWAKELEVVLMEYSFPSNDDGNVYQEFD